MKLYGIDFTSAPNRKKPITVAEGSLINGHLTLHRVSPLKGFEEFEQFLEQKGPWMAGIDFPFGLPGAFLSTRGLPHDWQGYVEAVTRRPRAEFEKKIKSFKAKHDSPYKEPLRFTDVLASAQSPLKLVNPPVGKMFYEGSRRILESGASILPCHPKRGNRIILEAYPALVARRFADSYKSDSKDTAAKKTARKKIIAGVLGSSFKNEFGFSVTIDSPLQKQLWDDFKGDCLDAVLCCLQTAWACQQGKPDYGIPKNSRSLTGSEGWIVDPSLHLIPHPRSSHKTKIPAKPDDTREIQNLPEKLRRLTDIGLALSAERNLDILLEMIMQEARNFTYADGGTLYILGRDNRLHYKIFQNDTLDIRMGGRNKATIPFPPLEMNPSNVSSYVAMTGHTVSIPDVRKHEGHDFSGPWKFDKKFNYRTQSMLLTPMKNKNEEVIGIIQLVNARKSTDSKKVIAFTRENVRWIQSLASQAAVAITHVNLVEDIRNASAEVALARDMAMDANAAKSKFLANMTHELRTPMNAIIGYTDMLLEEPPEKQLAEFQGDLEKISGSAHMLMQLINGLLDLSKIEAGKMEINLESFKVEDMIETAVHTIQPMLQQNKNTLSIHCDENLGYMEADIIRVRQTLINLLSNACKFTEGGKITLEAVRIKKKETPWIIFKVTDTGIGIPQDKLRSIFAEFTQADSSITRKFGGTGLGLAISQRFCRMMGGSIAAQSELNEGSTFFVQIPVKVTPFTQSPKRRASDH